MNRFGRGKQKKMIAYYETVRLVVPHIGIMRMEAEPIFANAKSVHHYTRRRWGSSLSMDSMLMLYRIQTLERNLEKQDLLVHF
jgi:hypothetical protein